MSENGEIYSAGQNFTLPPALMAVTNLNSGLTVRYEIEKGLRAVYCRMLMIILFLLC